MSVLTLLPSRTSAPTDFLAGSYAYVVADRPVRQGGVLVTPEPIVLTAELDGDVLSADLVPNADVDEGEPFLYTVSAFDPEGRRLYVYNLVMPATDSTLFAIVPLAYDDPYTCAALEAAE